jgi:hypothetical protein
MHAIASISADVVEFRKLWGEGPGKLLASSGEFAISTKEFMQLGAGDWLRGNARTSKLSSS